jgi:hypothetical protein
MHNLKMHLTDKTLMKAKINAFQELKVRAIKVDAFNNELVYEGCLFLI